MRHARVAVAAVAGASLLLAGCSNGTSKPTPAATSQAAAVAGAATPAPAAPKRAGLGVAQKLTFSGGTATMTVLKVVDPATPTEGKEAPGIRDVAVQIRIVGNGPATFASGAMITLAGFDADGQRLQKHVDWPTSAGPELDALTGVTVAAGDMQSGFVTFEVPTGAKLARIQYTPPGGAAVEWTVS